MLGVKQASTSVEIIELFGEPRPTKKPSKHRPLQVYPDVRRAFNTIDRAGPNVVVLPLEAPAGNGFNLEAFHRLIVKSDARAEIIIL
jgi:hypothetical protein